MPNDGVIIQPALPPGRPDRPEPVEIAPTAGIDTAFAWCRRSVLRPHWPLWLIPLILMVGIVVSIDPRPSVARSVLSAAGLSNVLWFFAVFVPITFILSYASIRYIRHAVAIERAHRNAFYVAWACGASWKPDLAAQGDKELGALRERRTETRESLRHLKWMFWGFEGILAIAVAAALVAYFRHELTAPHAFRAVAVCAIALVITVATAAQLSRRLRDHDVKSEEIDRAHALHQECNQEKQKFYRFPFSK